MNGPQDLLESSVGRIAAAARSGTVSAAEVAAAFSTQIEQLEPGLEAWAFFDPGLPAAQAAALDATDPTGPLHSVPIGVKDVFDTFEMPTQMGSPIYRGHQPRSDASCVSLLRSAGALIMGKTATAEFAGLSPPSTRNPRDRSRTPGGSSSGSAAAVASNMVPVALGSQTAGSVLRPASFCGIVGFKPTFGVVDRTGLKPAADSLDTVGLLGRTVGDIEAVYRVLTAQLSEFETPTRPRSAGLYRTHLWDTASSESKTAVEATAGKLSDVGIAVEERPVPDGFEAVSAARELVNDVQRARSLAFEYQMFPELVSQSMIDMIENGRRFSHPDYLKAEGLLEALRGRLDELFGNCDCLLAPCVPDEAPEGLSSTGDPALQAIWTALHVPSISLPGHKGKNGLPLGVQLVARRRMDLKLLEWARWVEPHVN